ncbi:hypothetical protein [Neptunicella sp. SCSIO 80796]
MSKTNLYRTVVVLFMLGNIELGVPDGKFTSFSGINNRTNDVQ